MLFLMNDRILTISGGPELCTRAGMPAVVVTQFKLGDAIIAAQTAFLEKPDLPRTDPAKATALAWLIASRSDANAALFVPSTRARRYSDVHYRLATVALTTLGSLNALQAQDRLDAGLINASVWRSAAA